MKSIEIMQIVEAQVVTIERAKAVMTSICDLVESEYAGITKGEQLLNLSYIVGDQLFDALPELQKVVSELELKSKLEKEPIKNQLGTLNYITGV